MDSDGDWRPGVDIGAVPLISYCRAMARFSRALPFSLIATIVFGTSLPACARQTEQPPLRETSGSSVGYETVAAALSDLRSQPNVAFTTENGWLIATDEAAYTIWSFAPEGYPAYPAVVKRQIIPQSVGATMQMSVLCEASKETCDNLVRTFAKMNEMSLRQ